MFTRTLSIDDTDITLKNPTQKKVQNLDQYYL